LRLLAASPVADRQQEKSGLDDCSVLFSRRGTRTGAPSPAIIASWRPRQAAAKRLRNPPRFLRAFRIHLARSA
jgi:hypothetical protein